MSGPVTAAHAIAEAESSAAEPAVLEVTESRASHVGAFPCDGPCRRRTRRTVGAWCFVDLALRPGRTSLPLRTDYEHALVVLAGAVLVAEAVVEPGHLAYLGVGRDEITLSTDVATRALLVGGVPFDEPVLMWWNYVARTRDEILAAHDDWTAEAARFGHVDFQLPRINVDPPPWRHS